MEDVSQIIEEDSNYLDDRYKCHFISDGNDEHRIHPCPVLIAWML